MPLKEKTEPLFGLMFFDQILFSRWFWKKDLSLPMSIPQKLMYADIAEKRLNCTGRKTAKTILLESRLIRESCIHQGDLQEPDEAMFFTPGQAHMTPVEDRIMSRLQAHPIFSLFRIGYNKNLGTLDLATGLRWYFRIEGTTGRETNMVGPRTIFMFGDELAFGNSACERGRKQTALPGCQWMYCGVPQVPPALAASASLSPAPTLGYAMKKEPCSVHAAASFFSGSQNLTGWLWRWKAAFSVS